MKPQWLDFDPSNRRGLVLGGYYTNMCILHESGLVIDGPCLSRHSHLLDDPSQKIFVVAGIAAVGFSPRIKGETYTNEDHVTTIITDGEKWCFAVRISETGFEKHMCSLMVDLTWEDAKPRLDPDKLPPGVMDISRAMREVGWDVTKVTGSPFTDHMYATYKKYKVRMTRGDINCIMNDASKSIGGFKESA